MKLLQPPTERVERRNIAKVKMGTKMMLELEEDNDYDDS